MLLDKLRELSTADCLAVTDGTSELTYRQVWEISEAIGLRLTERGNEQPVVIFGDKESMFIPCIIACLKARAVYVPVPCYYPREMVRNIVEDCKPGLVLNISATAFPLEDYEVLNAEELENMPTQYVGRTLPPEQERQPEDMVCMLYTSGSTGKPKGVCICYQNIQYNSFYYQPYLAKRHGIAGTRSINFASYAFSVSLCSFYYVFLAGSGTVVYNIPRRALLDYKALVKTIIDIDPHRMTATPSLLTLLLAFPNFNQESMPSLNLCTIGGEPLSVAVAKRFLERFPKAELICGYGCTESAGGPMLDLVTPEILTSGEAFCPIGSPSPENDVWLEDENGHIIEEDNVPGEMVIHGTCVSLGYLNNPEKNAANFFRDAQGRRCFRTHDIIKRINGHYYYLGRQDNQVKINGNRLELEDVEANIKTCPIVRNCGVTVEHGEKDSLTAFVVLRDPNAERMQSFVQIKKWLKDRVMSYMIPTRILFADKIPTNMNMKIDRFALHDMLKDFEKKE